jgi:hypothetical protein
MVVPAPGIFAGGQMTDLPPFAGPLTGAELLEIVSSLTSPLVAENALNYSITTALLAALLAQLGAAAVYVTNGQNTLPGDPLIVGPSTGRVYVNKSVAEPTYVRLGLAAAQIVDVLVASVNANTTVDPNGIYVTGTSGQLVDGLASVPVNVAYGGYLFRPLGPLNAWHLGTG